MELYGNNHCVLGGLASSIPSPASHFGPNHSMALLIVLPRVPRNGVAVQGLDESPDADVGALQGYTIGRWHIVMYKYAKTQNQSQASSKFCHKKLPSIIFFTSEYCL
jgi:hypothetical protein